MTESNIYPELNKGIFLFSKASRRHMGLIKPSIQGIMDNLSTVLKRSLCETQRLHAPVLTKRLRGVTFVHTNMILGRVA